MKSILLLLVFVSAVFFGCSQQAKKQEPQKIKNVLFIAIDDLKPELNCYGETQIVSPNIDKLAGEGVLFENAHCQQAVCGPSRASILTGMTPDYTGVWDLRTRMRNVNPNILAMPEYFKQKGFETVAIGKIYDPRCVDKQYDKPSWSVPYKVSTKYTYPEEWGEPALSYYVDPKHKDIIHKLEQEATEKGIKNKYAYVSNVFKPSTECYDAPDEAYMGGQIANNAIKYLEDFSKSDKPFFLAVGFKRPHLPFVAPKKYWDLYNRDSVKLAEYQKPVKGGVDIAYHNHGELLAYTDIPPLESFSDIFSNLIPEDKQRELIHGYYASTSFTDAQVGKVLDKLKELGLDKNTIIVLWGDHGWHLGDHALWCKHTNFEQATRVPLIVSVPGGKTGEYTHPVELVDIFPTLCDATGIATPKQLQGTSLMPVVTKDLNTPVKEFAVSQFDRGNIHGYTVRDDRYRLTIWMNDGYRTYMPFDDKLIYDCELYDYEKDPLETVNLYREKEYKPIIDKMMGYFKEYVAKQNVALKNTGANPANAALNQIPGKMNIDGKFDKPLKDNWKRIVRNGAQAEFEIVKKSELDDNTLKVNITKQGTKKYNVILSSMKTTKLEAGKTFSVSLMGRGGEIRVVLAPDKGKPIAEQVILGENTYVQTFTYTIPETANYRIKLQFTGTGRYLIDNIKTEYIE